MVYYICITHRVIGGGDGGVLREILKHKTVKEIRWIEIDEMVINLCKKYLPKMTNEAHNDSRVKLMIDDGIKYVCNTNKESYFDCIIVDSSDPEGPATSLFTPKFYKNCYRILDNYGILCIQGGSIIDKNDIKLVKYWLDVNRNIFKNKLDKNNVMYSLTYQTMYIFGQIGFIIARKYHENAKQILRIDQRCREIDSEMQRNLKVYSNEYHKASFMLPENYRRPLAKL